MVSEVQILSQLQAQYNQLCPCLPLEGPNPFQDNGQPLNHRFGSLWQEINVKKSWLKSLEN